MDQPIDRSAQYLKAIKGANVVAVGAKGTGEVDVDGIAPETVVKTGDYKAAFDTDSSKAITATTSEQTDVPGFTVPK